MALPEGYPGALSDDDLADSIDLLVGYLNPEAVTPERDPTILLAFLSAGHQEELRRLQTLSIMQSEKSADSARRTSKASIGIAVLALLIALAGTGADYFGDQNWQEDQTRILTEIRDGLPEQP